MNLCCPKAILLSAALLLHWGAFAAEAPGYQSSLMSKERMLQLPFAPEIVSFLGSVTATHGALTQVETPLALRFTSYHLATAWNCIAAYSDTFKDTLTRQRPSVFVTDPALHESENRALCGAQAWQTFSFLQLDLARAPLLHFYKSSGIEIEDTLDADVAACGSDTMCLQNLADSQDFSPRIMGHIVGKLAADYSLTDGYNPLGTDDGACEVNCRAYADPTGYQPVHLPHNPPSLNAGVEDRWCPLLEDNGLGYFFYQEHVTPHIGTKAKFRAMPEDERGTRVAPQPQYSTDLVAEADTVIARMATLDDTKKVEIETFDSKLTVADTLGSSFVGKVLKDGYVDNTVLGKPGLTLSYERLIHFTDGLVAADFDSMIIAWKEKVRYDLIRPTTVIKNWGKDVRITTWAPGGVQNFPASNFEAYIRVMPHSEYVSGSACIFEAQKDYILKYMEEIGLDPTFPVSFPRFLAGSSKVEPGVVPAQNIQLKYPDIETMAEVGSQSRLDGGMHFDESVPSAQAVCSGIGDFAAKHVFNNIS